MEIDEIIEDSDVFYEKYKPVFNHIEGPYYEEGQTAKEDDTIGYDMYFETYGPYLEYVKKQAPNLIWTLLDDGEKAYIVQGYRLVNRMNYLIASVPYKEGDKHTFIDRIYSDMEE
jgi:hypothetical protein